MDIKIPVGRYHIIDGEKVTIRYPGQEWSCARCHQLKHSCPGFAVARNCTAERVLLSSHMEVHWRKIGFKPEMEANSEVDDLLDIDIQVGHVIKEKPTVLDNSLQNKYKSVIIKGFVPETPTDDAFTVISDIGLPPDFNRESVSRNVKTGVFTISNLVPEQCLNIMEKMHAKKFLGRKIFVTSVVECSPKKTNPAAVQTETTSSNLASTTTGNPAFSQISIPSSKGSELIPNLASPVRDPKASSVLAASKAKDCQSNNLEEYEFDPPLRGFQNNGSQDKSNLCNMVELQNKRKASLSPETKELTRKEKKAVKREQKVKSKSEQKAKMVLDISSNEH